MTTKPKTPRQREKEARKGAQASRRELKRQEAELALDVRKAKELGYTPHTRRAIRNDRKRIGRGHRAVARALELLASIRRLVASSKKGTGERALEAMGRYVGWHEDAGRPNRAPWLDKWSRDLVGEWMVGQSWCGLACIKAYADVGVALPKDTVSTVAILNRARAGNGYRLVDPSKAQAGDLVVMDFSPAPPEAMHVGLARGPMRAGVIPTREGNTSPSRGGSQNNGGGLYDKTRPAGVVRCVARPILAH